MHVRPLADPVQLMASVDQVEEALARLKNVRLSITGINLSSKEEARE